MEWKRVLSAVFVGMAEGLETFLSGMETIQGRADIPVRTVLETFLSGMETPFRRRSTRRGRTLKPSLVEWKLFLPPIFGAACWP